MITGNKYFNYHAYLTYRFHNAHLEFSSTHLRRNHMTTEAKCPFHHDTISGTTNQDWWPNQLKLELLHQHSSKSNPMADDFDYAKEFKSLDFAALKKRSRGVDDRFTGLVASRLRSLWSVVYSNGLA
jgi:hypothetical protein